MEDDVQKIIMSVLLTVDGLDETNTFYLQADQDYKAFPRYVFFQIITIDDYDTEKSFERITFQLSSWDIEKGSKIIALKNTSVKIREALKLSNMNGMAYHKCSRIKRTDYREEILDQKFGIHQTFRMDLTKK